MILNRTNLSQAIKGPVHPSLWTAIIPAAGKGTRLNYALPKALFPLGGVPLVQWAINKIDALANQVVLVISPTDQALFAELIRKQKNPEKFIVALQTEPQGTVDAILCAEKFVTTRNTLVIWGDHYSVRSQTVNISAEVHESQPDAAVTFPTCERDFPYIAISRSEKGKILSVLQSRELSQPPPSGENDCGIFCFRSQSLFSILHRAVRENLGRGFLTQELNLLSLLPLFDSGEQQAVTLQIASWKETLGINTPAEAQDAEVEIQKELWNQEKNQVG